MAWIVPLGVLTIATVAVAICFAPAGRRVLGRGGHLALALTLVAGWSIFIATMLIGATSFDFEATGLMCALRGGGGGLIAGAAMLWIWRKSDPWTPRASGAVVGAAAGCIATAAVGLACSLPEPGHIVLGHWAMVPLLALLGASLGRRVLRP
jgi:hypothetical protein